MSISSDRLRTLLLAVVAAALIGLTVGGLYRALLGRQGRSGATEARFREAMSQAPAFEPAGNLISRLQARTAESVVPPGVAEGPAGGEGLDLARGRLCVRQFQRGEMEELYRDFSFALAEQMSFDDLLRMQLAVTQQLGEEAEVLEETIVPGPNFRIYTRTARFENHAAEVDFVVQLTADRKIAGLGFRLARRQPGSRDAR